MGYIESSKIRFELDFPHFFWSMILQNSTYTLLMLYKFKEWGDFSQIDYFMEKTKSVK